jgi:bifunctional UDP-N-acetylglucosamine pyrophosphorylase/glucosamine-1-phosphate N-acetyltransferase
MRARVLARVLLRAPVRRVRAMSSKWTAVVLAAGQGTRMRSSTPKVAHAIAGRAIVRHVVVAAREAGVDDIVVVTSVDADAVRKAAGEGVRFAVQDEQLGTGHAVLCARESVGAAESVLILNGDVPLVLPSTLRRLMAALARGEDDADPVGLVPSLAATSHATPGAPPMAVLTALVPVEEYGVLELAGHRIVRITETKAAEGVDRKAARYINSGQYAVRASWLWSRVEQVPAAANGERYLTTLAAIAHDEGNPAVAVVAEEADEVRGINDRCRSGDGVHRCRRDDWRGYNYRAADVLAWNHNDRRALRHRSADGDRRLFGRRRLRDPHVNCRGVENRR